MACSCSDQVISSCGCCCGFGFDCNPPEPSQGPAGPQGPTGPQGDPGTDGANSFTASTSSFVVPAIGNPVTIAVAYGSWAVPGQPIFVQTAGTYQVVSTTATSITATNIGASGNAAPATVIATNRLIGPSGYEGTLGSPLDIPNGGTGQSTATAAFNALAPTTTNGDIIFRSAGSNTRLAIGSSGQLLTVTGGLPAWTTPSFPASAITSGILGITNGGTGGATAADARTNLGVGGLTVQNVWSGDNTFITDTNVKRFRVLAGLAILFDAQQSPAVLRITGQSSKSINFETGEITNSWTGFVKRKQTLVAATPYNINGSGTNFLFVSTYSATGASVINLPAGTAELVITIIDAGGLAGTNAITINRSGSDTILGGTSYDINNNYGAVSLTFVSSTSNWVILP